MAKAATSVNYRALISQSDAEIATEQLDSTVEQADISFKQGLLSIESKLISAKSDVSLKQGALKKAESALTTAKRSAPCNLVQSIIDSKVAVEQAEENLRASKKAQEKLQVMYDYLVVTQKELFS